MSWAIRLEGVGRRYGRGGPWVLREVDLELRGGGLLRVEGGNGSGKSTLLRLLAGIDAPSAGRISGRAPARGYVPERFPAALPLTALAYLTHLGRVRGLRSRAAADAGRELLERFDAQEYAHTRLRELSKGSSQKVAVAQGLLGRPGLLLLDEAWTGLDQPARATLDEAVRERVADGGAVVFVDHDPRRLAGEPDASLRIKEGRSASVPGAGDTGSVGNAGNARSARGTVDMGGMGGAGGIALTRIEAEGAPGAGVPGALPDGARGTLHPDGLLSLTVPATESDAALRALLGARPPWHVRSVHPVRGERGQA
ncbi:ATP-binding cassette domain-containing protein [Streptomyces sp. NBC_01186]|uniref:ABC transporter ATP-binding protein n=1 Tax=Streptomyces sp. NBC_01186 TaxID=2903765 RepID=UPI002E15F705|nr:ATP-binding cassette domain-containing protein [Streptomyces sp. NBC_01186]